MALHGLTPAEVAFLTAPGDGLSERLTRRLAAILSARLQLPVRLQSCVAPAPAAAPAHPAWQPDPALSALWLTRRLGGRRAAGAAPFVPGTCIRTLDAALAECWLDAPAQGTLPPVLAWRIAADSTEAVLVVQLPSSTDDMTRWAREVIRHG